MKATKIHTIILDASSDTSPSAPSPSPSIESQTTTTTQSRNVTPITPSKRTRSQIADTSSLSSSSITRGPPSTEIPNTPQILKHHQVTLLWYIYQTQSLLNAT